MILIFFLIYKQVRSFFDSYEGLSFAFDILVESNETIESPFINVLPQSYRSALPLPSIFHCREFIHPSTDPFFHNIELILGPGQTELSFQRSLIEYSQFYCSLYGSPNVLLVNRTNSKHLLEDSLTDVNYISTSLTPGTCLFIPSDWLMGVQLNNSISILFTFETMLGKSDERCTKIEQVTLDQIPFSIEDQLNISAINLMIYFYQYLNLPTLDQEYTSARFLHRFQTDQNISQLVIEWTPELIKLIELELFPRLDVNSDERFSIEDYFDLRQSNLKEIEGNLPMIFEDIRRMILIQYTELSETIKRISQQVSTDGFDDDDKERLINMINNLPESVKQNLRGKKNMDINEILNKIYQTKSKPSTKKKLDRIDL